MTSFYMKIQPEICDVLYLRLLKSAALLDASIFVSCGVNYFHQNASPLMIHVLQKQNCINPKETRRIFQQRDTVLSGTPQNPLSSRAKCYDPLIHYSLCCDNIYFPTAPFSLRQVVGPLSAGQCLGKTQVLFSILNINLTSTTALAGFNCFSHWASSVIQW